jgi:hypothetical protein
MMDNAQKINKFINILLLQTFIFSSAFKAKLVFCEY